MLAKKNTYRLLALVILSAVGFCLFRFSGIYDYVQASPEKIMAWYPRFGGVWLSVRNFISPILLITLLCGLTALGILHFEKVYACYKITVLILQKSYSRYFLLGATYVILSLYIGEIHPFTLLPMYSNIPNYAYSFYFSDHSGKMYPSGKYFGYDIGALSHIYTAIGGKEKILTGFEIESPAQLKKIGEVMTSQMKQRPDSSWPAGVVDLHRVCYFMAGDSIFNRDIVMYETSFR